MTVLQQEWASCHCEECYVCLHHKVGWSGISTVKDTAKPSRKGRKGFSARSPIRLHLLHNRQRHSLSGILGPGVSSFAERREVTGSLLKPSSLDEDAPGAKILPREVDDHVHQLLLWDRRVRVV